MQELLAAVTKARGGVIKYHAPSIENACNVSIQDGPKVDIHCVSPSHYLRIICRIFFVIERAVCYSVNEIVPET